MRTRPRRRRPRPRAGRSAPEVDGPRRRGRGGLDRPRGDLSDVLGRPDGERLLHHRREHRRLVGRLVQHAAVDTRAAQRGRDVGGDHEDRRARRPRLADGAERVGRARAGGGQRDAERAGGTRIAVGGVRGGLLVADADEPDRASRAAPPTAPGCGRRGARRRPRRRRSSSRSTISWAPVGIGRSNHAAPVRTARLASRGRLALGAALREPAARLIDPGAPLRALRVGHRRRGRSAALGRAREARERFIRDMSGPPGSASGGASHCSLPGSTTAKPARRRAGNRRGASGAPRAGTSRS